MISVVSLVLVLVAVNAQVPNPYRDLRYNPYYDERPKPYSFNYNALLDDGVGQSSRMESADGSGRVTGSYTLNNDEGHFRVVDYVADENGFRASIRTNEPGTESKNPADVVIDSSAVPYQYIPRIRRPYLNAPAIAPVVDPAVVPENVPVAPRPFYRRPSVPRRNYPAYRPGNRFQY